MVVDKWLSSNPRSTNWLLAGFVGLLFLSLEPLAGLTISDANALRIGKKIWQNECGGTVAGLTSWNQGEDFASLGIGHFIWYPKGRRGPFEESFPRFVHFASQHGAKLPELLLTAGSLVCPWQSRTEFLAAHDSAEMRQLRQFLIDTIDLQAKFMVERLQEALSKILAEAAPSEHADLEHKFSLVASTAQGCYALVDFVNFKGEGVLHSERYRGQGWGLLQVLEAMPNPNTSASALRMFADAARSVLRRRVNNSPPERNEKRWLPGWLNRIDSYNEGLR